MEVYVQLIFILALAKYCLKASLTAGFRIMTAYAAAAAAIGMLLYPMVIRQPMSVIATVLSNQRWVENGAVVTTVEAVAGIFLSVALLDNYFMARQKRSKSIYIMKVFPGILFCFAIAYFELLFFKWRAGGEFMVTALFYAALVFIIIVAVASFFKYALPGESPKLELAVLLNSGILIIGLLVSSSVADYNISHAVTTVEWYALITLAGIAFVFFILGFLFTKINFKSYFKHK